MKKQLKRMALCLFLLMAALSCGALAANGTATPGHTTAREDCTVTYDEASGKYTAAYSGLPEGHYALLVVRTQTRVPETGAVVYSITDDTIAYIGQTDATGGSVSFTFPIAQTAHCVVILGGPDMAEPKILGSLIKQGAVVTGTVTGYAPAQSARLELYQTNTTSAPIYETDALPKTGGGESAQAFAFDSVQPGTYDLKVTKPGHTSYWLKGIVVADDMNLAQNITLHCGDVNGDGKVNVDDLVILTSAANYNKNATDAANPLCDLNADGKVNVSDLLILVDLANYNKGSVTETCAAP